MTPIGSKLEQRLSAQLGYINPSIYNHSTRTHSTVGDVCRCVWQTREVIRSRQIKGGDHISEQQAAMPNPRRSGTENARTGLCEITLFNPSSFSSIIHHHAEHHTKNKKEVVKISTQSSVLLLWLVWGRKWFGFNLRRF